MRDRSAVDLNMAMSSPSCLDRLPRPFRLPSGCGDSTAAAAVHAAALGAVLVFVVSGTVRGETTGSKAAVQPAGPGSANPSGSSAGAKTVAEMMPLFRQYCGACHGADKAEGGLRLDRLNPDLINGSDHLHWRDVLNRLNLGDMPPDDATPLPDDERERLANGLLREMKQAELARNPATHFRRLTRLEYQRTMQDLLGLNIEFASRLPEDGRSASGFRNDGERLRMSPMQFETYFQIAEEALQTVIVEGPPPTAHRYRIAPADPSVVQTGVDVTVLPRPEGQPCESFAYITKPDPKKPEKPAFRIWNLSPLSGQRKKESEKKKKAAEAAAKAAASAAAGDNNGDAAGAAGKDAVQKNAAVTAAAAADSPEIDLERMLPPDSVVRHKEAGVKLPNHCIAIGFEQSFRTGAARLRVRAARVAAADGGGDPARSARLTLAIGLTNRHGAELKTVGQPVVIDHDEFRTYEFLVRMEDMPASPMTGVVPFLGSFMNARVIAAWNSAHAIKGEPRPPLLRIDWIEFETPFFEQWPPALQQAILPSEDAGMDESARARGAIERFATRAYRRPLTAPELDRLLALWEASRGQATSFESSLRETLAAVLSAPQFLALAAPRATSGGSPAERVDDYQLASRLSYFLWCTMPDEQLIALARSGKLRDPAVLVEQTRRMLADPRSWAFIEQFTEQWLELDRLQRLSIQSDRYPGFDDELASAMRQETLHFVAALFRENRSLLELIDSRETFLNDRMADHYGIPGVSGPEFRRVALAPDVHRGGVLTHAAILAGTSDGVEGHPIKRGMWLLRNLLDETPPPPPPNVPELERKDPKNRAKTVAQLLAAHRDSKACAGCHRRIDPWGLAFEEYDAVGNWQRDGVGAKLRLLRTKEPVVAAAELPTGTKIDGLRELQAELLRSKPDDLRKAAARKLLSYALGRSLNIADIEAANGLAGVLRDRGDGLGTLVEMIVQSEAFHAR